MRDCSFLRRVDLSISLCKAPTFLMRLLRKCKSVRPVIGLCAVSPVSLGFLVASASSSTSSRYGSDCRCGGGVERAELVVVVLWGVIGLGASSTVEGLELRRVGVAAGTEAFG